MSDSSLTPLRIQCLKIHNKEVGETVGSIKWKLVLLYVILVVFVIVISGVYIVVNIQQSEYNDTYKELEYTAKRITETLMMAGTDENKTVTDMFKDVISALMLESINMESKYIYLLDENGNAIYYRDEPLSAADRSSRTIIDAMDGKTTTKLYVHQISVPLGDGSPNTVTVGDYAAAFHVSEAGGTDKLYILFLRQSMAEVQETMKNTTMIIIASSIIGILISGVLAYFLASSISRPIQRLTRKTQEMAKGNLDITTKKMLPHALEAQDELDELENNFNYMAQELSKMLREVNSEKNKLSTVFAHMADGLVVYDLNGNVIHFNPAARRLMGRRIMKSSFSQIFSPLSLEALLQRGNDTYSQMIQFQDSYINAVFAAYMDEERQSAGLIVVLQDMTEQKQLEEMQKEFVANVSHELRTPITTIKSYVETLLDGEAQDPEILSNFLGVINNESDRMAGLITELLELSRIDSRQVKLKIESVNLAQLVEDSVLRHQIHAEKKSQTLLYETPDVECWIQGDPSRMEQVFRNLIINAVKYSPPEATIRVGIRVDESKRQARVYVRDNGIGIEPKERDRIFERFYRVDKARSRSMGGTGLGLSIAKEIMELHGGSIQVDSIYGKGSTFWLTFPFESRREDMEEK